MSTSSSKLRGSQQRAGWPASNEAARGALVGLIPLGLLLVAVLVVLALATFAHTLISTAGFFVEQQVAVSILVAGFLATLIVYIIATVRTLRQVAAWQQDNLAVCAHRPVGTRVHCAGCCLTSAACVLPASVSCSVMVHVNRACPYEKEQENTRYLDPAEKNSHIRSVNSC